MKKEPELLKGFAAVIEHERRNTSCSQNKFLAHLLMSLAAASSEAIVAYKRVYGDTPHVKFVKLLNEHVNTATKLTETQDRVDKLCAEYKEAPSSNG